MAAGLGFVFGFVALVFVHHATAQTVHDVGDTTGWTTPSSNTFYSDWAKKNTFVVGDSLAFKFTTGSHDVLKVTKGDFETCNIENGIGNVLVTGPATVKLDTAGVHYFICTVGKHCLGGQKLSVTVSASASATPGGAVAPSPNTTDEPPAAPSPNTTDEPPATPTLANSPTSSVPNNDGSPAAPAPSSSTAVMATFYVTLSAIVMNMLF